jgi:hypothetical protein
VSRPAKAWTNAPKAPRTADVVAWVAIIKAPLPPVVYRAERQEAYRAKRVATAALAGWDLGPDGLPKVKAVTP